MTAFARASAAIFGDSNFGEQALYMPASGDDKTVTVVRHVPDETFAALGGQARIPALLLDVQASDVAQPREGDRVALGDETYRVRGARPDMHRLVWTLDLDPA